MNILFIVIWKQNTIADKLTDQGWYYSDICWNQGGKLSLWWVRVSFLVKEMNVLLLISP